MYACLSLIKPLEQLCANVNQLYALLLHSVCSTFKLDADSASRRRLLRVYRQNSVSLPRCRCGEMKIFSHIFSVKIFTYYIIISNFH